MIGQVVAVAAGALVLIGLVVTTLGVLGMFRMPDVYTELHSASKAVVFGIVSFLVASMSAGDPAVITRALLIAVFLMLTTPVGAHAIARAAWQRREPMLTPEAIDQSGANLTARAPTQPSSGADV